MWFLLSSFLVKIIVTKDSMEHGSLNSISFFIQFFYYCKRCVTFKLFGIKKFGDWFLHLLDAKAFPVNQLRILGFAPFTSHTSSFFFFLYLQRKSMPDTKTLYKASMIGLSTNAWRKSTVSRFANCSKQRHGLSV